MLYNIDRLISGIDLNVVDWKGLLVMKKRILSVILLCSLVLASCGGAAQTEDKESSALSGESSAAETQETGETRARDELAAADFGGRTFSILAREETRFEFDTEQDGELVNDAVYNRNKNTEDRFNCKIEYIIEPGAWGSKDTYQGLIRNSVMSGDDTYQVVTGQANIVLPLSVDYLYHDLADSRYIDFEKPYWKDGYTDNAKIDGHLYAVCGDFALTTLTMSNALFFNKSIMDKYGIEYPYQKVMDGKWTLDEFLSIVSDVSEDLNGDGKIDKDDLHGFAAYNNSINPFNYSTGIEYTRLESDGSRTITFPDEKAVDIYDKVKALCKSDAFIDTQKLDTGFDVESAMAVEFKNGKCLMMGMYLGGVEKLRDMDVDFGILPYPKYDEKSDYRTSVLRRYTITSVPTTAQEPEQIEMLLEAMASEGYNKIVPAYYDIALKGKYTRDAETVDMLDIISGSSWFDFCDIYFTELGYISDFMSNYVLGSANGLVSSFEKQRKAFEKNLEKLREAYANAE